MAKKAYKKNLIMRSVLGIILFAVVTSTSFAQTNYQDVIYLKNGSIIRGTIIEHILDKSIKIETADKSVFAYNMYEVEKLTKEENLMVKGKQSSEKRRGFIGLSLGANIPIGLYGSTSGNAAGYAKTGLQINLINFGYLFSKNVGITATWFGAANLLDDGLEVNIWSYGGLMVGPLFSVPVSENVDFNITPMIGYAVTTEPFFSESAAASIAFNFGATFLFNLSEKFALTLGADYFSTKSTFEQLGFEQSIRSISINGGFAFKLK